MDEGDEGLVLGAMFEPEGVEVVVSAKVRSSGRMLTTWVESGGSSVSSTVGVSSGGGLR